jgi:hypothetical protein
MRLGFIGVTRNHRETKGQLMRDEKWYRQRARQLYQEEGELEVDDDALVSVADGSGAYVQGWVWVDSEEDEVTVDADQANSMESTGS